MATMPKEHVHGGKEAENGRVVRSGIEGLKAKGWGDPISKGVAEVMAPRQGKGE